MRLSEEQIKIAIVTPAIHCGGATDSILHLGRALVNFGFPLTIVTTGQKGVWYERIQKNGMRAHFIKGIQSRHPFYHSWKIGNFLRKNNYDVVFFSNYERFGQACLNMLPNHVAAIPMIRTDEANAYSIACMNSNAWNVIVAVSPKLVSQI
jgi:hypothetical protein